MRFITFSRFFLILSFPLLIFLVVSNFASFDRNFYKKEFSNLNVLQNVPNAPVLHEKVINFIHGKNSELPSAFNYREKQHLQDVRKVVLVSRNLLFNLIIASLMLLLISASSIKKIYLKDFIGRVLVFGALLTLTLAGILFLLISSNFSSTFEAFHELFFKRGTFMFDPSSELIVNLYPEQLFMDLGIKISIYIVILSVVIMLAGICLLYKKQKE